MRRVDEGIGVLDAAAQHTSSATGEVTAAALELARLSGQLREEILGMTQQLR